MSTPAVEDQPRAVGRSLVDRFRTKHDGRVVLSLVRSVGEQFADARVQDYVPVLVGHIVADYLAHAPTTLTAPPATRSRPAA